MFVMIESGMALFSIQLARVVTTALIVEPESPSDSTLDAFNIIVGCHEMLNGIIPTIILVRVSMGLSFDDETSWKEAAHSLRFADSIPESRSIDKENDSSMCEHDDIQMSEGPSTSETLDKSMDDSYIHDSEEGVSVELV
jgi:hypothetical protein